MIRKALAILLAALWSAPVFAARIEAVRVTAAPMTASAPAAASLSVNAPLGANFAAAAPALAPSLAPAAALTAPFPIATLPTAAPAAAPALASSLLPAPIADSRSGWRPGAHDARGPPERAASPRSESHVAATVAGTVHSWGVPVEQLLKTRDVLLIGEDHASLTTIETLARELPRLAKAGVTTVGIEGLKKPQQGAVDDYVSRRTDAAPVQALGFSPARVQAFTALLHAARENGVRVVALGLPLNDWAAQVAALAAAKTGDPVESFGTDFVAQVDRAENGYEHGFNEALVEVLLTRRNRTMAELAWNAMGPGGKAVIVAGQAHIPGPDTVSSQRFHVRGDYGDLARELSTLALRAYSLTFTGGLFTTVQAALDDRAVRPLAHAVVEEASPRGAPAYVPLGPDQGLWHAGGTVGGVLAH